VKSEVRTEIVVKSTVLSLTCSLILKMEVVHSSETSVNTTRLHVVTSQKFSFPVRTRLVQTLNFLSVSTVIDLGTAIYYFLLET
jgi:hypothetical protein